MMYRWVYQIKQVARKKCIRLAQMGKNFEALFINYQLLGLTLLIGAARDIAPRALAPQIKLSTQNWFSLLPAAAHTCVPFAAIRAQCNDEIRFFWTAESVKIRRRPSKISEQIGSFHFLQARGVGKWTGELTPGVPGWTSTGARDVRAAAFPKMKGVESLRTWVLLC